MLRQVYRNDDLFHFGNNATTMLNGISTDAVVLLITNY